MTVIELINELTKLDPRKEVLIVTECGYVVEEIHEIREENNDIKLCAELS